MALEWLKGILGVNYTDEIDTAVSAEIGKGFVSKTDFNTVNLAKKKAEETVETQNKTLAELEKVDVKALQEDLEQLKKVDATALQTENKGLKDQLTLIGKGIPADKVSKYQKLAEAYVSDEVDFAAAVDLALKDFPVAVDTGVPGGFANPPVSNTNSEDAKMRAAAGLSADAKTA